MDSLNLWLVHVVSWHMGAAFFAWLDLQQLARSSKFTNRDKLTYSQMIPVVVRNQVCIMLPVMIALEHYGFIHISRVATLWDLGLGLVVTAPAISVSHDVLFYVGHRILHMKWAYRLLGHDVHHQTFASVAASSMYMSPLDFLVQIIIPFSGWIIIIRFIYFEVIAILFAIGGITAMYEHSGFNFFPTVGALDTRPHALHHLHFNVCFSEGVGSPGVMDKLFCTSLREMKRISKVCW